jgi:hypothetical protein
MPAVLYDDDPNIDFASDRLIIVRSCTSVIRNYPKKWIAA